MNDYADPAMDRIPLGVILGVSLDVGDDFVAARWVRGDAMRNALAVLLALPLLVSLQATAQYDPNFDDRDGPPPQAQAAEGDGSAGRGAEAAGPANEKPPPAPPTAAPTTQPPPPPGQSGGQAEDGRWVYTAKYGWVFVPGGVQTEENPYSAPAAPAYPYAYVYQPALGWSWLGTPWIWGAGNLYWPWYSRRFGWWGGWGAYQPLYGGWGLGLGWGGYGWRGGWGGYGYGWGGGYGGYGWRGGYGGYGGRGYGGYGGGYGGRGYGGYGGRGYGGRGVGGQGMGGHAVQGIGGRGHAVSGVGGGGRGGGRGGGHGGGHR